MTVTTPPRASLASTTPGVKPGILTTEFWLTLISQIALFLNTSGAWTYVHPQWATMIAQGAILGLYTISRAWTKAGATTPMIPTLPVSTTTQGVSN